MAGINLRKNGFKQTLLKSPPSVVSSPSEYLAAWNICLDSTGKLSLFCTSAKIEVKCQKITCHNQKP